MGSVCTRDRFYLKRPSMLEGVPHRQCTGRGSVCCESDGQRVGVLLNGVVRGRDKGGGGTGLPEPEVHPRG